MKKYTVIYTSNFVVGGRMNTLAQFRRCETDAGETVRQMLEREELWGSVAFIFEGHPLLEGENPLEMSMGSPVRG